jgi:hypothetical protein
MSRHMRRAEREETKKYDLYAQAWPAKAGWEPSGAQAPAEKRKGAGRRSLIQQQLISSTPSISWTRGCSGPLPSASVLGIVIYFNGYAVANILMKIAPLRWIHTWWLYRRMYFDELYMAVFRGRSPWASPG